MVDERESPSAGWREVYHEMAADPGVEEATRPCPDCGRTCEHLLRDVYECEEHGVFRASAGGGDGGEATTDETDAADARGTDAAASADETVSDATGDALDDPDEVERRAREPAD